MYGNRFSFLKAFEVFTWISLFALIPFTAIGYLSESSLPGSLLYPLKREIENAVLAVDSFNVNAKAFYEVALVNKRLQEVEKLMATSQAVTNLNIDDISTSLTAAQASINNISDSAEKAQAQQQLVQSINDYETRLQDLKALVEETPTLASTESMQSNANNVRSNIQNSNNNAIPTIIQLNPVSTDQATQTPSPTQQINGAVGQGLTQGEKDEIINNINQITQTLNNTVQNLGGAPIPVPTPSPILHNKPYGRSGGPSPRPFH